MKKDLMYWNRSGTNSNFFHIFVNGESLCGVHEIRADTRKEDCQEVKETDSYNPKEDCQQCYVNIKKYWTNKILEKLRETNKKNTGMVQEKISIYNEPSNKNS
jgi:hypothetical protein